MISFPFFCPLPDDILPNHLFFFSFSAHAFPPPLLPSKCAGFFTRSCLLYFVPVRLHFVNGYLVFPFLSSSTHPCVCSSINSSIHCPRTETKVQLYCPVHGEHATTVFVQSFYPFPPTFDLFFYLFFYIYFMQSFVGQCCLIHRHGIEL